MFIPIAPASMRPAFATFLATGGRRRERFAVSAEGDWNRSSAGPHAAGVGTVAERAIGGVHQALAAIVQQDAEPHAVHGVAEAHAALGVGEADRAAGAHMS